MIRDPEPKYGLAVIGRQTSGPRGVLTAVRTYESPLDRRLEEAGFEPIANVSLLLKENLVRAYRESPSAVRRE